MTPNTINNKRHPRSIWVQLRGENSLARKWPYEKLGSLFRYPTINKYLVHPSQTQEGWPYKLLCDFFKGSKQTSSDIQNIVEKSHLDCLQCVLALDFLFRINIPDSNLQLSTPDMNQDYSLLWIVALFCCHTCLFLHYIPLRVPSFHFHKTLNTVQQ